MHLLYGKIILLWPLLTMSWQEESFLAPSGMFQKTILFLFDRFSRSSSLFSNMAIRVQSTLLLKVSFNVSTPLLVKSSPCCRSWISPDRLAVLDSSYWSLRDKTSWRPWLSESSLSTFTTKLLTSRVTSSKLLSLGIPSCELVVPLHERRILLMLARAVLRFLGAEHGVACPHVKISKGYD